MKKVIYRLLGLALLAAAVWGGYRFLKQLPERQERIATARVRRGDVVIRTFSRAEVRAVRSVTLTAPNLFGTVQVTRLAPAGALAHDGDLIIEFDDSERRASLEEDLLGVQQIDEQIKKQVADLAIRDSQDSVDLLRTRYAVRRAELEVSRNEIMSAIDAKKNLLTLEEQRRRLKQLESDIQSRKQQGQAQLAVLREQRNKGMIDVQREQLRIAQAKLLSPMTGLVAVRQNRTGFFMFGQQIPDIREGDTLQPGMPVADVLDLSELELIAKVGELDRANLHEGQEANIQLDAVPNKTFRGRIKGMSGTASANVFSGDPAKKFDVVFSIDMRQLLGGLGVKPAEIDKIMEQAARNAKRGPVAPAGGPGMRPGGMDPQRMQAAFQRALGSRKIQDLSPDERQKLMASVMQSQAGDDQPGGRAQSRGPGDRQGRGPGDRPGRQRGGDQQGETPSPAGMSPGGPPSPAGMPPGAPVNPVAMFSSVSVNQFTEEQRAKAKLPPPPEEDSDLQVLLRPGLLADVEIIVEKIPDALHIPAQAIFEKNGKMVVYVQNGNRFDERPVQVARRSESTMVLAGGVKPGEVVALADPTAAGKKGDRKSKGGSGVGSMPAGGGKK